MAPKGDEKKKKMHKGKALPSSVLTLKATSEASIAEQLRRQLEVNHVAVVDLMREWDADGDCCVSKDEFRAAVSALGFDAPIEDVDFVFDALDGDHSGTLEFAELKHALRKPMENLKQQNAEMQARIHEMQVYVQARKEEEAERARQKLLRARAAMVAFAPPGAYELKEEE